MISKSKSNKKYKQKNNSHNINISNYVNTINKCKYYVDIINNCRLTACKTVKKLIREKYTRFSDFDYSAKQKIIKDNFDKIICIKISNLYLEEINRHNGLIKGRGNVKIYDKYIFGKVSLNRPLNGTYILFETVYYGNSPNNIAGYCELLIDIGWINYMMDCELFNLQDKLIRKFLNIKNFDMNLIVKIFDYLPVFANIDK